MAAGLRRGVGLLADSGDDVLEVVGALLGEGAGDFRVGDGNAERLLEPRGLAVEDSILDAVFGGVFGFVAGVVVEIGVVEVGEFGVEFGLELVVVFVEDGRELIGEGGECGRGGRV